MHVCSPSGLWVTRRGTYFPLPSTLGNRSLYWSLKVPQGNKHTLVTSLLDNMCIIVHTHHLSCVLYLTKILLFTMLKLSCHTLTILNLISLVPLARHPPDSSTIPPLYGNSTLEHLNFDEIEIGQCLEWVDRTGL